MLTDGRTDGHTNGQKTVSLCRAMPEAWGNKKVENSLVPQHRKAYNNCASLHKVRYPVLPALTCSASHILDCMFSQKNEIFQTFLGTN